MNKYFALSLLAFALALIESPWASGRQEYGILNKKAPEWQVKNWINLPKDKKEIKLSDLKGKVVYLYAFQSWCPGCHSHGFPTLKKVHAKLKDDKRFAFAAIQTVFEGFHTNTPDKLQSISKKYGLNIPFGHDGVDGKRSELMRNYRTGGTPWAIIIDKKGVVRYNHFSIDADKAIPALIKLAEE